MDFVGRCAKWQPRRRSTDQKSGTTACGTGRLTKNEFRFSAQISPLIGLLHLTGVDQVDTFRRAAS